MRKVQKEVREKNPKNPRKRCLDLSPARENENGSCILPKNVKAYKR
jgi:hypothetical protein